MISSLFKKITAEDLIDVLKKNTFNESKANSMLKQIDINHKTKSYRTFFILLFQKIELKL